MGLQRLQIGVSIVLFENEIAEVMGAIQSVKNTSLETHITVVDNSPTDVLREVVESTGVGYTFAGKNLGFGKGHNLALSQHLGHSDYHLVLNPDVRFESGVLEALYSFMCRNEEVGLVMPRVLNPDGREQPVCKLLPTPVDLFGRRLLHSVMPSLVKFWSKRYELVDFDLSVPRFIPNLAGCFLLIRDNVLREVGGFDECYFMYLEDVDLCRRIAQQYPTVYYPYASIFHQFHRGSYRDLWLLKIHVQSAIKYFNKWGWLIDRDRSVANRKALRLLREDSKSSTELLVKRPAR